MHTNKLKLFLSIYSILCFLCFIQGAKLPDAFHRCKVSEATDYKTNRCMEEAVQHAIRYLSISGEESLGLPDLDPLRVQEISIRQGDLRGPVAMEIIFKNLNLNGLSSYKIKSFRGRVSSPKDFVLNIEGVIDKLRLIGEYSMNGRVLILPVRGAGDCNLTLSEVYAGSTIIGESVMKNDKEYLKIRDYKMSISLRRAHLHFDNLFGDKAIAANVNKFMNDNWSDIYNELRPSIEDAIGKIFTIYSKRILERIPFKNIFIVE